MPIVDIEFKNGIFSCKETGRIDETDAKLWAAKAAEFAASSDAPIVAVIDAMDVTAVTRTARRILQKAAGTPNLAYSAVATNDFTTEQTARVIGLMAVERNTYVYDNLADARAFAEEKAAGFRAQSL